ncbi:MAG: hypothetical protein KGL39_40965 [Patescibacteria group bacterium]|nr:hypothetical protein [Patescibacteria group bacterium]
MKTLKMIGVICEAKESTPYPLGSTFEISGECGDKNCFGKFRMNIPADMFKSAVGNLGQTIEISIKYDVKPKDCAKTKQRQ